MQTTTVVRSVAEAPASAYAHALLEGTTYAVDHSASGQFQKTAFVSGAATTFTRELLEPSNYGVDQSQADAPPAPYFRRLYYLRSQDPA
jgi:hypothetical protein